MKNERSISESIALVERRLQIRRERMVRHLQEARAEVRRSTKWLPYVAAVIALGAAGFAVARHGRKRPTVSAATVRTTQRAGVAATVLALLGTAVRFALSPSGRALWQAWRTRQATRGLAARRP